MIGNANLTYQARHSIITEGWGEGGPLGGVADHKHESAASDWVAAHVYVGLDKSEPPHEVPDI